MKMTYDNPLIRLLSRLGDLMLLQLAFLVTSLPLFTVGAGLTALFAVSKKMQEDSVSAPLKEYFLQFRGNFKNGTYLWLCMLLLLGITYADARFCAMGTAPIAAAGQVVSDMLMIGVLLMFLYVFPQAAWFENSPVQYMRNGLLLALAHPVVTVGTAALYFCFFLAAEAVRPLFFLLGFSGAIYLASFLFRRVFFPDGERPEKSTADRDI